MFTDNDIEASLVEVMAATTMGLDPPTRAIIDEAVRLGQRKARYVRVRGTAAAIGVLAVIAGTTFGAVAVADRPSGTGHATGVVAAPSASATSKAATATPKAPTASPRATPSATKHPESAPKHLHLSLTQVEAVLADLLPPGRLVRLSTADVGEDTNYWANYFPGTHGYQLSVDIVPSGSYDTPSSCAGVSGRDDGPRPTGATPKGCDERNLAHGAHALLIVSSVDQWGFYEYQVIVDRADGVQVTIALVKGKATPSHGSPVTVNAAKPPIMINQLLTVAESDRWN